ncbi:hypothetical protein AGRO_2030 [Agrobacterium sp. ATCC 31749]|nr:hypothetical protein AGRO_2030 [Agrobacterium sp. ATCC 31749]
MSWLSPCCYGRLFLEATVAGKIKLWHCRDNRLNYNLDG